MADADTLPETDPCYSTLEAFKHSLGAPIDDFWRAMAYRHFGADIERWQPCCPELREKMAREGPVSTDLDRITKNLPSAVYGADTPCGKELYFSGSATDPLSRGQRWFKQENDRRETFWTAHYSSWREQLHACCVKHFKECLARNAAERGSGRTAETTAEQCVAQFSPEHQPAVALPGVPVSPDYEELQRLMAELEGEKGRSVQEQVTALAQGLTRTQAELQRCEREAAGKKEDAAAKSQSLFLFNLQQCREALAVAAAERNSLQADLQAVRAQAVIRPGTEALLAFPAGEGSALLALVGATALLLGFLLGLPGRKSRRAQLLSGALSALCGLLIYLGVVAFLPDTRWLFLLLALTTALLLVSLRTLLRAAVLLRQRGRRAISP